MATPTTEQGYAGATRRCRMCSRTFTQKSVRHFKCPGCGAHFTDVLDPTPLLERVLGVACPTCVRHGVGAGRRCVTVGGNPRRGFHAARIRQAVKEKAIRREEYDEAYRLEVL